VNVVTVLCARKLRKPGSILGIYRMIHYSILSKLAVDNTHMALKQLRHAADHSPASKSEVKNEWSYAYTPHTYIFILSTLTAS
jgi:hypothetical protein